MKKKIILSTTCLIATISCNKTKYNIEKENNNIETTVNQRFVQMGKKFIQNRQMRNVVQRRFSNVNSQLSEKKNFVIPGIASGIILGSVAFYLSPTNKKLNNDIQLLDEELKILNQKIKAIN